MDPTTNLNPDDQLLSPEEIFASQDIDTHDIVVPEWKKADGTPGTIRLKMLSAADLSAYTDAVDGAAKRNAMVIIIMKSAVRADGTPLFREKSDLARLQAKSVKAFARLQDEILRINGMDERGKRAAKND